MTVKASKSTAKKTTAKPAAAKAKPMTQKPRSGTTTATKTGTRGNRGANG